MVSDISSFTESKSDDITSEGYDSSENFSKHCVQKTVGKEPCLLRGRRKELSVLSQAYQRVVREKSFEAVIVHGESGSGKTSLIETLRKPVCRRKGYFCAGKYIQNSEIQEPYSAIMAAFSDLCDLILQSSDFSEARRAHMQEAIGSDGTFLAKAITNLSPLINESSQIVTSDTKNEFAYLKFKIACKTFLKAVSFFQHPIVFFIDDIQWMDKGSSELIEMFLLDADIKNVLFILAYREEEGKIVDDFLGKSLRDNATDLFVNNLDGKAVNLVISDLLGSTPDSNELAVLSNLTLQRTNGNPFHVIQFIETIRQEGLLYLDNESKWIFDVDTIKRDMMVSDTVLGLLSQKIRRLDERMQDILKVASLLGYQFSEMILLKVVSEFLRDSGENEPYKEVNGARLNFCSNFSAENVKALLDCAINEGLIERMKEDYQFSHDKLQKSFHDMVDETLKTRLHYIIGKTYLTLDLSDRLYYAAVHLNKAGALVEDESGLIDLANVNNGASKICRDKSAFLDAALFLRHGLSLLSEERKWTDHFALAFEMTESLAKMELVVGNLEACKEITNEVLLRCKSVKMKVNSLLIDVEVRMAGNEVEESISTANRCLKVLGTDVPQRVTILHVLRKRLRVRRLLRSMSDHDIISLPLMQNITKSASLQLLVNLCMHCLLKDEFITGVYTALLATELTIKDGLSAYSASAFTMYGLVESFLGNHNQGYRYGQLAMTLLIQNPCKDAECSAIAVGCNNILHWRKPLHKLEEPLRKALHCGLEIGDVVYGTFCVSLFFGVSFIIGKNLVELESFMRKTYSRLCDLSQEALVLWAQASMQCVLNLRRETDEWKDLTSLTGEVMNEEEYDRCAKEDKNAVLVMLKCFYKTILAYHFGFFAMAEENCKELITLSQITRHSYALLGCHFYSAMVFFEQYRRTSKRKYLVWAKKRTRALQQIHNEGNPNAAIYLSLLEAEVVSTRKKQATLVISSYERAIAFMKEEGYVHMEALANERAGFALAEIPGHHIGASQHFDRAIHLYHEKWGADAKAQWLRERQLAVIPEASLNSKLWRRSVLGTVIVIPGSK